MKSNKKTIVLSVIAIATFMLLLIGATYAYFTAQGGSPTSANLNVTTYTTDVFTFTTGSDINIYADQSTFASGKGNATGSTFARASLTANNKTNTATENYNVYFNISDNNFKYSVNTSTPELLLTIKDADNNEVTSISGLEHKTVTDGKGASISGFDITTKTGLLTLIDNREITASPSKVETWNITITFVNYNSDQSSNMGKTFDGQVLISKDSFSEYTPNTINSVTATKTGSNLTVKLNMDNGTNEIDKYYFAIAEKDSIAMLDTKVMRLSNKLAATTPTYVESTTNSYTFASVKDNANYEISAYAIDKKKIKTNIYKYDLITDNYSYPVINSVTTTSTNNSITVSVTATKGTNNISKYYYSIDNGNSFIESTSDSYTFSNLASGSNYRIIVKVSDTNNKYSNIYVVNEKTTTSVTLADYVISQYTGTQGENSIYYHNASLANGAGDNSYRYAGASETTNNYVCFGSEATPCPTDNLYRIIGVFGNNVKLIKYDYATSALLGTNGDYSKKYSSGNTYYKGSNYANIAGYHWNMSIGKNTWSESELNKTNLNKNYITYLNNIDVKWAEKIATTTWKVGGNTYANIVTSPMYIAYQNEITNAVTTNTTDGAKEYSAKIGLMYVSDYGYASIPTYWTYVGNDFNDETKDYSAATSTNWMYMGLNEWTISRNADASDSAFVVDAAGAVKSFYVDNPRAGHGVRPSFSLLSSVAYAGGIGTSSDPIQIG